MALVEDPEFVEAFFNKLSELNIEIMRHYIEDFGCELAMFAGTYVVTAIMNIMPQHTVGAASLVFGLVCAGCLVVEFINTGKMKESV